MIHTIYCLILKQDDSYTMYNCQPPTQPSPLLESWFILMRVIFIVVFFHCLCTCLWSLCWQCFLRCAIKRCSLCVTVSCCRRGVLVENLRRWGFPATCFDWCCVICMGNRSWFSDCKHFFKDEEKCALVINDKIYVSWKQKVLCDVMLHYVIGEHQAYIQRKMSHPILQLAKAMRGIHFLLDEIMCVQCQVYQ